MSKPEGSAIDSEKGLLTAEGRRASEPQPVDQLRREIAQALCVAQVQPLPRSSLQKMLYSLLLTAFAGLDEDSGADRAQAFTVALHALREWRERAGTGEPAVSGSRLG